MKSRNNGSSVQGSLASKWNFECVVFVVVGSVMALSSITGASSVVDGSWVLVDRVGWLDGYYVSGVSGGELHGDVV